MPYFSTKSRGKLDTCDYDLRLLFSKVIEKFDCTILCGHRNKDEQNRAYNNRKSKLKYPYSKHNKFPSMAVDVVPYPIDWNDHDRMRYFAGYVKGIAEMLNIKLRWGGDWDRDTETKDNRFNDLVHFELDI